MRESLTSIFPSGAPRSAFRSPLQLQRHALVHGILTEQPLLQIRQLISESATPEELMEKVRPSPGGLCTIFRIQNNFLDDTASMLPHKCPRVLPCVQINW